MAEPARKVPMTFDEYIKGEQTATVKHELIGGVVYMMAGAKARHTRITGNVYRAFANHLQNSPCEPFSSDMSVKVDEAHGFYPDVTVDCSGNVDDDHLYTETPTLIVEVLSKSTRRFDKTLKLQQYRTVPTLKEYVMIEQDVVDVEVLRRENGWQPEHYFLGDDVTFTSIGCTVSVEDIYERVQNEDMREWLEQKAKEADDADDTSDA